jgi:hypothetical protein
MPVVLINGFADWNVLKVDSRGISQEASFGFVFT